MSMREKAIRRLAIGLAGLFCFTGLAAGSVIFHDDFTGAALDTEWWSYTNISNEGSVVKTADSLVITSRQDAQAESTSTAWVGTKVSEDFGFLTEPRVFEFHFKGYGGTAGAGGATATARRNLTLAILPEQKAPSTGGAGIGFRLNTAGDFVLGFANSDYADGWVFNQNVLKAENNMFVREPFRLGGYARFTVSDSEWEFLVVRVDDGVEQYSSSWSGLWTDSNTGAALSSVGWDNGASVVMGSWQYLGKQEYAHWHEVDSVTVIPEPGSLALAGLAGLGLWVMRRRRR